MEQSDAGEDQYPVYPRDVQGIEVEFRGGEQQQRSPAHAQPPADAAGAGGERSDSPQPPAAANEEEKVILSEAGEAGECPRSLLNTQPTQQLHTHTAPPLAAATFADWPQGRGIIITSVSSDENLQSNKEATENKYKDFLESCGFQVQLHSSQKLSEMQQKIPAAISTARQAVVLLLHRTDRAKDLDDIVDVVNGSNAGKKLLIFCRVCDKDFGTNAKCVANFAPAPCRKEYPNLFILSMSGQLDIAREFVAELTEKQRSDWPLKSVSHTWYIKKETDKYNMDIGDGLEGNFTLLLQAPPARLLRNNDQLKMGLRDGQYLKQLQQEVVDQLRLEDGQLRADPSASLVYRCSGKKRKALILNNVRFENKKHRPESLIDCQNLVDLLRKLGFDAVVKLDLKAVELKDAVRDFADDSEHGDCCLLVVMSHGCFGQILGTDGVPVLERDLLRLMHSECVKGKPRLVIFQACRPDTATRDAGTSTEAADYRPEGPAGLVGQTYHGADAPIFFPESLNNQCGLIVGHSTSPGDLSFRNHYGSRFILSLCATWHSFAHKEDVVSMITRVNFDMVHGFRPPQHQDNRPAPAQLPWWSVQSQKKFFLVPTESLEPKAPDAEAEVPNVPAGGSREVEP